MKLSIFLVLFSLTNININEKIANTNFEVKEEKNIQNIQNMYFNLVDDSSISGLNENIPIRVFLKYKSDYLGEKGNLETFEQVKAHREKLFNYYSVQSKKEMDSLKFTGFNKCSISKLGPYLSFEYSNLDNLLQTDYIKLKTLNSKKYEKIYIENMVVNDSCNYSNAKWNDQYAEYSYSKALADIGIYSDMTYDGEGIKIGILDEGIPDNTINLDLSKTSFYGTTKSDHTFGVSTILGGYHGVAKKSNLYFASRSDYSLFECLDWLISTANVNIINFSGGVNSDDCGKYDSNTDYFDYLVKETKVTIVCANGNTNYVKLTSLPATGLNVISVGASNSKLKKSIGSSTGVHEDYNEFIKKPNVLAPGYGLYGIPNISEVLTGTSLSAPMVSGMIALLMQEYPYLQSHPEVVMSLLDNSCNMGNGQVNSWDEEYGYGIVNYQNARLSYNKMIKGNISNYASTNSILSTKRITIPQNSTFKITGNIMCNSTLDSGEIPEVSQLIYEGNLQCSKLKLVLTDMYGNEIISKLSYGNLADLRYINTSSNTDFLIKIYLEGNKVAEDIEEYAFSYSINTDFFNGNVYISTGNYLDEMPTFKFNIINKPNSTIMYNYKLVITDYRNENIVLKSNLLEDDSYTLTKTEWENVISNSGIEYYAYVVCYNPLNDKEAYYSSYSNTTLFETHDYNHMIQIKPYEWGFAPRYYFANELTDTDIEVEPERKFTQITKNGLTISTERLRCGYIEKSYVVLSPTRLNAGEAYLTLLFDKPIYSYMFGVTAWSIKENLYSNNLSATVSTLDSNGTWHKSLDLINDIILPNSRTQVDRYEFIDNEGIYGLKFEMSSIPT